ncbi:MAG: exonuclease subunit SbcD, partial [Bacillota bacterium]|nr:exonuclease subunit SbcD [Bacillota bacterium]
MRLLHTGDLHIGKRLHEFSLLDDQEFILQEIRRLAREHRADALVVAGDVYDKSLPATDAVGLLDDFLSGMSQDGIPVLMISGNHDSGQRLNCFRS